MNVSDMVLPDGFTTQDDENKIVSKIFERTSATDYVAKVTALRQYSCKYADSIETILKAQKRTNPFCFQRKSERERFKNVCFNFGLFWFF